MQLAVMIETAGQDASPDVPAYADRGELVINDVIKADVWRWRARGQAEDGLPVKFETTWSLPQGQRLWAHGSCQSEAVCAEAEAAVRTIQVISPRQ